MSSEVLRRKLFKTVLSDSRSPSGILASSPEMVETVQRRAQGGVNTGDAQYIQAIGQLAQQGDKATLQNIFADTRLPTTVRNAAREALGSLATKTVSSPTADFLSTSGQQLARMPKEAASDAMSDAAGFGQGILDAAASENRKFVDSIKTAAGNDIDRLSSLLGSLKGTGEVARPGPTTTQTREASGLAALLGPQFDAADPRTEAAMAAATPGEEGLPSMLPNSPLRPSVRSPFTPGPLAEDEDIVDDEYTSMTPITPGEQVSQAAISGADTQTVIKPKIDDLAVPKTDLDPDNNLANFSAQLDSAKTTSEVSKITAPKIKAEDFVGEKEKVGESWTKFIDKSFKPTDRVTFSDMEEKAKELMDFDPEAVEADKKSAFFMNLMKAGLAIAAGESDNLVTNLAKGLGVGLEGYGKDLNRINADEKEKRKEYRATVMKMVDDENDYQVAMDGLKVQVDLGMARLAQADNNARQQRNLARDTAELSAAQAEAQMGLQADIGNARNELAAASNALQFKTLELNHFKAMADLGYREGALDEQKRSNVANEALKRYTAELAGMSKEQIQVMGLGSDFAVLNDDGTFKEFTPEGEKLYKTLITTSSKTKSSITDLVRTSNAHAVNGNIISVPLSSNPVIAQQQGLVWESTFKETYSKALEDGNEELAESILADFQASIGGQAQGGQSAEQQISTDDHIAANAAAKKAGESTYTIGSQTFSVQ